MTSPSPCAQIAPPPKKRKQTAPPTIPIHTLYPQSPPTGHLLRNTPKTTGPELTEWYETLRYGAEAHRQTRRYIQKIIKPGVKLIEVAETIEECTRKLMGGDGKLESGKKRIKLEEMRGIHKGSGRVEKGGVDMKDRVVMGKRLKCLLKVYANKRTSQALHSLPDYQSITAQPIGHQIQETKLYCNRMTY